VAAAPVTAIGGEAGEGEVVAALPALGYSLSEARVASRAASPSWRGFSLEERVKAALRSLVRE
jgi:Holliday junction resolvasome RuvABC DNA-binding subunit